MLYFLKQRLKRGKEDAGLFVGVAEICCEEQNLS